MLKATAEQHDRKEVLHDCLPSQALVLVHISSNHLENSGCGTVLPGYMVNCYSFVVINYTYKAHGYKVCLFKYPNSLFFSSFFFLVI